MPIALDELMRRMSGGPTSLETRSGGLLVDQSDPMTRLMTPPPLNFRENMGQVLTDEQFPLVQAGDVVPFPKKVPPNTPGRFTGPTPTASEYMTGRQTDPSIRSLGADVLDKWMQRVLSRGQSGGAGGDKWPTQ